MLCMHIRVNGPGSMIEEQCPSVWCCMCNDSVGLCGQSCLSYLSRYTRSKDEKGNTQDDVSALTCGSIIREMSRHEPLVRLLLQVSILARCLGMSRCIGTNSAEMLVFVALYKLLIAR